ncbi:hypothetical protein ES705_24790 [subsurface metagenome]
MGETSKVGISASKVVALIGALVVIQVSIEYFTTGVVLTIIYGIIGLIIAAVIFISLEIVDMKKVRITYLWWINLIIGALLLLFEFSVGSSYLGGILVLIAALLEFLSQKKTYAESKIVALIGACYLIFESVMLFLSGSTTSIALSIVGFVFAIILILTLQNKIDVGVPYAWWVVLIIGFVVFTWVTPVSGTIIMVAFILILMAF